MHRNDSSKYFLYIEPTLDQKSKEPKEDIYTEAVEYFLTHAEVGASDYSVVNDQGTFHLGEGWRGMHRNCDDESSTSRDYLMENGFITNSLCVHYVRWFRDAIDGDNLKKLEVLKDLYNEKFNIHSSN